MNGTSLDVIEKIYSLWGPKKKDLSYEGIDLITIEK